MKNAQMPILDGIDPELVDRMVTRRDAIRGGAALGGRWAAGLAVGSVPAALAVLAREAGAQSQADVVDALQFAFVLENLENEFYRAVLGTSAVAAQNSAFAPVRAQLPAAVRDALLQIQTHEQQHVDFLRAVLPQVGAAAPNITAADFDFTGGNGANDGPFLAATTDLDVLLLAAQAFEDTGVRAYKGQAGRLLVDGNNAADLVLESALRIHAVEARHAAKIRRIRRQRNPADPALRFGGYVLGGGAAAAGTAGFAPPAAGVVAALDRVYGGASPENNTRHVVFNGTAEATIDAAALPNLEVIGDANARAAAAQMAFDEPLTKAEVIQIVQNFIRNDAARGLP